MLFQNFTLNKLRDRFKILALICLILAIYMPGLDSGFFVFDDIGMLAFLKGKGAEDAISFFLFSEGRYWRPLIFLSFLFDVSLFDANSVWMHQHNILLHVTNTVLVFLIVRRLLPSQVQGHQWPIVAAALFAIHPANTEAVNWISGRTDLLAAFFALSAVYLILLSLRFQNRLLSWFSGMCILLACMAKEVAFPLFPAAFLSLFIVKNLQLSDDSTKTMIKTLCQGLPYLVFGCIYLWLRQNAFESTDQGVGKIIEGTVAKGPLLVDHVHTGFVALGFYMKKLFVPTPLNFAIDHVSPFYFWLGLLSIAAFSYLIFKRDLRSVLVLFLLCTIAPAILNAIFHIAWTPYAERYLYLPSAFLCIGFFSSRRYAKRFSRSRELLILCVFLFGLGLTIHRNLQWMQPIWVLEDAIRQNPDNIKLRINYANVLANGMELDLARQELNRLLFLEPTNQVVHRNLALISLRLNEAPTLARKDLDVFYNGQQEPDAATLNMMIEVNEKLLEKASAEDSFIIKRELFLAYRKHHMITGEPEKLFAAVEKASTAEEYESLRSPLLKVANNNALAESVRAQAATLFATIFSRRTERVNEVQREVTGGHHQAVKPLH